MYEKQQIHEKQMFFKMALMLLAPQKLSQHETEINKTETTIG
jgi:hypothetical protein